MASTGIDRLFPLRLWRRLLIGALALAPLSLAYGASAWLEDEPEFLPVDKAFVLSTTTGADGALQVRWDMPDGYYLYRHRFGFDTRPDSGLTLGEPRIPDGKKKIDDYFGEVEVYYHSVEISVPVAGAGGEVGISYQGCADHGLCYPPETRWVALGSGEGQPPAGVSPAPEAAGPAVASGAVGQAPDGPVTEERALAATLAEGGWLAALALFFIGGLGLAFTPCVLPMVPILSSIIVGQGQQLSRGRAFSLSLAYVLGMALTYALLGVLVGLFGASLNLQAALQAPAVLVVFALVFVALSLAMFGFYELRLPERWQNGLNAMSARTGGGRHLSVFVMGALSALVVSPCVSAPLAGALIYLSTTGDAVLGGAALLALGLGMGTPLLLIGASGGHLLPRAGAWMNAVKAVFGVLLLGVAIWLLERVVPAAMTLALWSALAIGVGVYLGALDFSPRQGWGQLWKAGGAFSFLYGLLLLIGAASGADNPLRPLDRFTGGGAGLVVEGGQVREALPWQAVDSLADVDAQLRQAAADGQPAMLDLYADWCISCKVMERSVFPQPEVAARLRQFRLLRADITANNAEHKALLARFGLFGPPSMVFFAPDGSEMADVKVLGELGREALAAHLGLVLTRVQAAEAAQIAAN